ncbi:hypothetical protein P9112_014360 [Eukaryota sp. TZLM1-RC]
MFFRAFTSPSLPDDCEFHLRHLPDIIFLAIAIVLLIGCISQICHLLVSALLVVAKKLKLSDAVTGSSFLAMAAGMPELFTHLIDIFSGGHDLGTSAIIGAVTFNAFIGIGFSALTSPFGRTLRVESRFLIRDVFFWLVSNFLLLLMFLDGKIESWESFVLIFCYGVYIIVLIIHDKHVRTKQGGERHKLLINYQEDIIDSTTTITTPNVQKNIDTITPSPRKQSTSANYHSFGNDDNDTDHHKEQLTVIGIATDWILWPASKVLHLTVPDCSKSHWKRWYLVSTLLCLVWLAAIEYVIVELVSKLGCLAGLSSNLLGTLLLGPLMSLPDALVAITMVKHGRVNSSMGCIFGCNIFSLLIGMGLPWVISTGIYPGVPLEVSDDGMIMNSFIVLGVAFIIVISLFTTSFKLTRNLGFSFVFFYVVYVCYVVYSQQF